MIQKIKCPTCKKEILWKETPYRPFCSLHCKTKDLGNWALEKYRIPSLEQSEADTQEEKRRREIEEIKPKKE